MIFHSKKGGTGEERYYHIKKLPTLFSFILLLLFPILTSAAPAIQCNYLSPNHTFMFDNANASLECVEGKNITGYTMYNDTLGKYDYATMVNTAGTDYAPSTVGDLSTNFTISFWYKSNSTSCPDGNFFSKSNGADPNRYGIFTTGTSNVAFSYAGSVRVSSASSICTDYNWHMVTFSRRDTNLTLFIDGVLSASASNSDTLSNSQNFCFGKNRCLDGAFASNMSIDDLRIWESYALTDSQILELYGNQETVNPAVLYSQSAVSSVIEGDYFNLSLAFINSSLVHSNTTAILNYNNTNYTAIDGGITFTINLSAILLNTQNSSVKNYFWYYNLTYVNGTRLLYQSTTNQQQTDYRIKITNDCTVLTNNKTFNITFKDEISDTIISSDAEISFRTSSQNSSLSRYDSYEHSSITSTQYCISPSFANYTSDITVSYSKTGYSTREWYTYDYRLTPINQYQTLYLLSTGNQSSVIVHVSDASDNPLSNILVEMERYDLPLDQYSIVESELTSSEGEASFQYQSNAFYRFKLYQSGVLKTTTDKAKITSTDLYYRISQGATSTLLKGIQARSIDTNLTYNYNTETLNFVWVDTHDYTSEVCVNLTATSNSTLIFGQCSNAATGSISYVLSRGNTSYYAFAYATHTEGGQFNLESIGIEGRQLWQDLGEDSGFITFMIILVFGLIGAANAMIGLILVLVGLFVVWSLETAYIDQTIFTFAALVEIILFWLMLRRER